MDKSIEEDSEIIYWVCTWKRLYSNTKLQEL